MKKQLFFFILCAFNSQILFGQATVPGNAGVLGNYLGWNAATAIPLEIRHNAAGQPIDFLDK